MKLSEAITKGMRRFSPAGLSRAPLFFLTLIVVASFALSSCNEGPEYKRPSLIIPTEYRGAPGVTMTPSVEQVKGFLGDMFWWDFLQDDVLKNLVATAIVKNYDVRLAVERIMEAQARVGVARASQFPTVNATGGYQTTKISEVGPTPFIPGSPNNTYSFNVGFQAIYEADFWGRLRNATGAARADLLASEEATNVALMTLVTQMATAYFQLREFDKELEISKETLESRQQSLELVSARQIGGVATMLDVDQSKGLVISAEKTITQIEEQILLQENYISYLLGEPPHEIERGKVLDDQLSLPPIPPGLTSSLLLNRPDIRKAELQIIAANFQVRAARAAYFPQIVLTADGGTLSKELSNLFSTPSYTWDFIAGVTQPIFNGGQIRSQVQVTESQKRQAIINYESVIQNAFKEVSDSLIGYQKGTQYLKQQDEFTKTLADQSNLARIRYEGGVSSYLEVLDTERQYFDAELGLVQAQANVLIEVVKLYKALGGGWKQKPEPQGTAEKK